LQIVGLRLPENRCSRGIGLGFVKALSENPENAILATCRNPEAAEELQQIADASEDLINVVPLNQDKKESIEAAATAAEELLGDLPVDYIINNAAYASLSISVVPS
jgi:NAD(P)-dependent dehydrogenase (short-subunit alcohol dehydrogenase family)